MRRPRRAAVALAVVLGLRGAFEVGAEGWLPVFLEPATTSAEGLKAALRYNFLGAGYKNFRPFEARSNFTGADRFQHVSNGGTSLPNRGFNSDTGVIGVSVFFP